VPYSAANYTSTGSWTVAAGNVFFHDYQLLGNDLLISLAITNGMLSAAHGQLYAGGFPFTWAGSETTAMGMGYPSGLAGVNWGPCLVNNGGDTNKLLFLRCALDSWPAGPIFVTFRGTFQVT
jgi:hypothetical protein